MIKLNYIVIGAYWGDEGKGKIVDLLAKDADWVVRYNGGDNAGHTIVVDEKEIVLHILPSGALQGKNVAIGPDVFFNPKTFFEDLDKVTEAGYKPGRILIDERCHIIMPYHIELDSALDKHAGIGTTKRGIGPLAKDRASRSEDLTISDMLGTGFRGKLHTILKKKEDELRAFNIISGDIIDYENKIYEEYTSFSTRLKDYIGNIIYLLNEALDSGKNLLLEGAQGTLLDIVHGTRPFVTSTNTVSGAASANLGIDMKKFKVIAIAKAYPTRVGEGPFPTQLDNELGEKIQKDGKEFGATTGRPRKSGNPDFVALRYSKLVNSVDEWVITKIDVLAGKKFTAAIAYEKDGKKSEQFPFRLEGWRPIYGREYFFEELNEEQCKKIVAEGYDSIPQGMKDYVKDLVQYTKTPVSMISLSPKRNITLVKDVLERTRSYLNG